MTNKLIKIEAEELWNNDFSWRKNILAFIKRRKLGKLMLKSARMLANNPEIAVESLPLLKVKPIRYVKKFKQIFMSMSEKGYVPTEKDVISVYDKRGTLFCCDGHRRLACILALGKQKMIEVSLSPTRSPGCSSPGNLF